MWSEFCAVIELDKYPNEEVNKSCEAEGKKE